MDNRLADWPNADTGSSLSKAPPLSRSGSMPTMNAEHRRLTGDLIELKEDMGKLREEARAQLHMLGVEREQFKTGSNVALISDITLKGRELEALKTKVDDIDGKLFGISVAIETLKAHPKLASQEDIVLSRLSAVEDKLASIAGFDSVPASQASESRPALGRQDTGDNENVCSITNIEIQEKLTQIDARLMQVERTSPVTDDIGAGVHTGVMAESKSEEGLEGVISLTRSYHVEESTWDSCMFMGFACTGITPSFLILLSIACTIFVEFLFILVVYANYQEHPFSEEVLNGLLHWRAVVGHDLAHADSSSHTSLVSQICAEWTAVPGSSYQALNFYNFRDFRKSSLSGFEDLNGRVLCNLALVLWCFAITQDIVKNYTCIVAVLAHPRGVARAKTSGDRVTITSFNSMQLVLIVLFHTLPRLVIAIGLGYVGILFLGYTTDVGDLVLNAVALVFVLDIDEVLFQSLVPLKVKGLMRAVEPLSMPVFRDSGVHPIRKSIARMLNGGHHVFFFRIVSTIVTVVITNEVLLGPFTDKMDRAKEYLCGGNQDFVCAVNKNNDAMMCSSTPSFDAKVVSRMSYHKAAVLEKINLPNINLASMMPTKTVPKNGSVELPYSALTNLHEGTIVYGASQLFCVDYNNEKGVLYAYQAPQGDLKKEAEQFWKASTLVLKELLDDPNAENCSQLDFLNNCSSQNLISARGVCARRCGCHDPWQGNLLATPASGCPSTCGGDWEVAAFYMTPPSIAQYTDYCEDVPDSVLSKEPSFQNYLAGIRKLLSPVPLEDKKGCALIYGLKDAVGICTPGNLYRSARLWCPFTCGCSHSDMAECPRYCSIHQRFQILGPPKDDSPPVCPVGLVIQSKDECDLAAKAFGLKPAQEWSPTLAPPGCSIMYPYGPWRMAHWSAKNSDGAGPGGGATTNSASNFQLLCKQPDTEPWDVIKTNYSLTRDQVKWEATKEMAGRAQYR